MSQTAAEKWVEAGLYIQEASDMLDDPDRTIGTTVLIDVTADLIEAMRMMHQLLSNHAPVTPKEES